MNEQPRDSALKQMTQRIFFAWMFGAIMFVLFWIFGSRFDLSTESSIALWNEVLSKLWALWLMFGAMVWGAMRLLRFLYEAAGELLDTREKPGEKKKPASKGLFDANSAPGRRLEELTLDEAVMLDQISTRRLEEKR